MTIGLSWKIQSMRHLKISLRISSMIFPARGVSIQKLVESPIYDTSIEGSVDLETWESFGMEEENSKFSFDYLELYYSKPHLSISKQDLEKQYNEGSDGIQLTEDQSHPSSFHGKVSYDLEQLGAYT